VNEKEITNCPWGQHGPEYIQNLHNRQIAEDKEYSEKLKSYIKDINELIKNNKLSEEDMEIINEALETASSATNSCLPRWKLFDLKKAVVLFF
jgi:hypothetical protein